MEFLILFVITFIVSLLWVRGIDKMIQENPDYKGEDFLNWDKETEEDDKDKKNSIHK